MTIKNTFAHLMGLGAPAAGKKADSDTDTDDDRKQRDGESDEDYQKRLKEMDDDGDSDKDGRKAKASAKKATGKKAESDDDDRKQRDGESDEDYQKRLKEMDDDDDDKDSKKAKAAAFTEKARCVSIMATFQALITDPATQAKAEQARIIMCADMPVDQAVAAVKAGGAIAAASKPATDPTSKLDERMQRAGASAAANNVRAEGGASKPDMNTAAGRAAAILASGNGSLTIKATKTA